ncbi:DALR anticodon-binding domain-containing protein 3-like isoform X2 [Corticium candelabrum]|uniref:DALR anticodon-binding domain-containing protein 3-like isoform X2 n=1 Tax=Corticium candelabrum TaxID=121492 RepID=UPI002E2742BC|nr:DALR anticodon-binding domain-containing protein 3-like isoform X2 [Corticium candelabrum]
MIGQLRERIRETLKSRGIQNCDVRVARDCRNADFVALCRESATRSCIVVVLNGDKEKDVCCIQHCFLDEKDRVIIILNRSHIFRQVLLDLPAGLRCTATTGQSTPESHVCIVAWFYCCNPTDAAVTAIAMRTALTAHHAAKLVEITGCKCSLVYAGNCEEQFWINLKEWVDKFGCHPDKWVAINDVDVQTKAKKLLNYGISKLQSATKNEESKLIDVVKGDQLCASEVILNLRQYMLQNDLPIGKIGYDKGMGNAVLLADGIMDSLLLEAAVLQDLSETFCCGSFLHVDIHSRAFHRQKLSLAWRMLCDNPSSKEQKLLLHFGVADVMEGKPLVMEDYYRVRMQQLYDVDSFKMRSTQISEEEATGKKLQLLTVAAIKFELLSVNLKNKVKVKLSSGKDVGGVQDNNSGTFVMYNCARMTAIMNKYKDGVKRGYYPCLPDAKNVDYSTLTGQSEWVLVWKFLTQDMLSFQEAGNISTRTALWADVQSNKVCDIMTRLAKEVSSYYSHVQILQEPKAHMLSCMFARLHLILGIKQMFEYGLGLLSLTPLEVM